MLFCCIHNHFELHSLFTCLYNHVIGEYEEMARGDITKFNEEFERILKIQGINNDEMKAMDFLLGAEVEGVVDTKSIDPHTKALCTYHMFTAADKVTNGKPSFFSNMKAREKHRDTYHKHVDGRISAFTGEQSISEYCESAGKDVPEIERAIIEGIKAQKKDDATGGFTVIVDGSEVSLDARATDSGHTTPKSAGDAIDTADIVADVSAKIQERTPKPSPEGVAEIESVDGGRVESKDTPEKPDLNGVFAAVRTKIEANMREIENLSPTEEDINARFQQFLTLIAPTNIGSKALSDKYDGMLLSNIASEKASIEIKFGDDGKISVTYSAASSMTTPTMLVDREIGKEVAQKTPTGKIQSVLTIDADFANYSLEQKFEPEGLENKNTTTFKPPGR